MKISTFLFAVPLTVALWAAGHPWDKPVADWDKEDAQRVLTDSPWAKKVNTDYEGSGGSRLGNTGIGMPGGGGRRGGGGYPGGGGGYPGGRGGGFPGGVGFPGGGGGRRGGGYPSGGSYPTGGSGGNPDAPEAAPSVTLRWESAMPVREAELKGQVTDAPGVGDGEYGMAVYGLPRWVISGNPDDVALMLKKTALLKRMGKKDIKATRVRVLDRDSGPVVIFLFPRTKEITKNDNEVEFTAKVGRLRVTCFFQIVDMMYQGKLEI